MNDFSGIVVGEIRSAKTRRERKVCHAGGSVDRYVIQVMDMVVRSENFDVGAHGCRIKRGACSLSKISLESGKVAGSQRYSFHEGK